MKLILLTRLTITNPQNPQQLDIKYFRDAVQAGLYIEMHQLTHYSQQACRALQEGADYCLAARVTSYHTNAAKKEKNKIYRGRVNQECQSIELLDAVTTLLGEGPYFYLNEEKQVFFLKERIFVETARPEFQQLLLTVPGAITLAKYNIAAEKDQKSQQSTLFQFWSRAPQPKAAPSSAPTPAPANDPMEIDKSDFDFAPKATAQGYSSF